MVKMFLYVHEMLTNNHYLILEIKNNKSFSLNNEVIGIPT